jgi:hypothetical protein
MAIQDKLLEVPILVVAVVVVVSAILRDETVVVV